MPETVAGAGTGRLRSAVAHRVRHEGHPAWPLRRPPVETFWVDVDAAGLVLRSPEAGDARVEGPTGTRTAAVPRGPSLLEVTLPAGGPHTVRVTLPGRGPATHRLSTLSVPPGPRLARVATISDLHLGSEVFGWRRSITEPAEHDDPPAVRCTRQALAEAVAWGADLIVVKGDVTDGGHLAEWQQMAELVRELGGAVPVALIPGNHDMRGRRTVDPAEAGRRLGLDVADGVATRDLPGVRVVLADTTRTAHSGGRVDHVSRQVVGAAAAAPAALVLLHHHLDHLPDRPGWPPGIPRAHGRGFLDELAAAQPRSFVSSGHTHRNRRAAHGPVAVTQVGSVKDYPGVWAGYTIHEGGITQVVRRVGGPSQLDWTERTARAGLGLWRHTSPGTLAARCFTHGWP